MTAESQTSAEVGQLPAPARRAVETYRARVARRGGDGPITVAWASGRVNLIGEHTDYNEGYVLPVAIDRVIAIAGRRAAAPKSRWYSVHHDQMVEFDPGAPAPTARGRGRLWAKYVRGVLAQLARATGSAAPASDAAVAGDVPVGGGMSSSAALEVAVATFASALGGPQLPPLEVAKLCQRAEQQSAGVRVGIMDQATSCLGRDGHAILLDCRSLEYEYVPINLPGVAIVVYDTGVAHTLAGSEYNVRREQCEEAAKQFERLLRDERGQDGDARVVRTLRDVTEDDLQRYGSRLAEVPLRRARHVVSENARVLAAVEALRAGDADRLGALLYASHASLRDDYEVSCPELDAVVSIASGVPGVLGARMMGAGFGGSALVLARRDALPNLEAALRDEYPKRAGRTGTLHVCTVSGGPQVATVAP